MSSSETFSLKWNEFRENISTSFGSLREDSEFSDVTLVCADGQQVEAHKIILAASSPLFQELFRRNKHGNPLIFMRGLKSRDLMAILDFMYHGETNICQQNLADFMALAEDLKLKGLDNGPRLDKIGTDLPAETKVEYQQRPIEPEYYEEPDLDINGHMNDSKPDTTLSIMKETSSIQLHKLDNEIKTMWIMVKKDGKSIYICQVCGKEGIVTTQIRDHIETNHIEGISLPCNSCEKTFRSRASLRLHKANKHKFSS